MTDSTLHQFQSEERICIWKWNNGALKYDSYAEKLSVMPIRLFTVICVAQPF